jgi:UDP-3-O-[3-hydroxymyristoyl] glucosamine N-acyltransferase LpxD
MLLSTKKLSTNIFDNQSDFLKKTKKLIVGLSQSLTSYKNIFWLKTISNYTDFNDCYLIISKSDYKNLEKNDSLNPSINHLICKEKYSPRLSFCIICHECSIKNKFVNDTKKHKKNKNIEILGSVLISENVEIGDGTILYPNVVIFENVKIGKNCIIRENSTLGSMGMGFEKNLDGSWIKFPQVGGLIIGDDVEIGSHSDIKKGALRNTIINNNCKLGSFTNIGHNCIIGESCLFTSHCVVAGSVEIGNNLFMGINSSIKNKIKIGANVMIGANSYVNKNINNDETVYGSPIK